jgi:hypothetical protein
MLLSSKDAGLIIAIKNLIVGVKAANGALFALSGSNRLAEAFGLAGVAHA